jgi:4'-phosphopantetheinyl transferase
VNDPIVAFRPVAASRAAPAAGVPAAERALLAPGATPKRLAEFAAGRAAGRAAVDRLLGARGRCAAVLRDSAAGTAQPVAVGKEGAPLPAFLSITHAEGVAAAAAALVPVGIDLVRIEPLTGAFRREAFSPGELAGWERLTGERIGGVAAACAGFAAKEAVVKWLGTGLTVPLLSVRLAAVDAVRPARLGGLAAMALALVLEGPVRCELPAWLARLGRYVVVVVARPALAVDSARSCG